MNADDAAVHQRIDAAGEHQDGREKLVDDHRLLIVVICLVNCKLSC